MICPPKMYQSKSSVPSISKDFLESVQQWQSLRPPSPQSQLILLLDRSGPLDHLHSRSSNALHWPRRMIWFNIGSSRCGMMNFFLSLEPMTTTRYGIFICYRLPISHSIKHIKKPDVISPLPGKTSYGKNSFGLEFRYLLWICPPSQFISK